jgi:caffeoyl-CoA O-methyltransferase
MLHGAMEMTSKRWRYTCDYLVDVFGQSDEHLEGLMERATEAGLPDIAVSADVGRLLMMLTSMTRGQLAVELGTLAGYSAIWIARGLQPGGRLITVEPVEKHADFAQRQLELAEVADRVVIRRDVGAKVLEQLGDEHGPRSVDVLFVDAVKSEYPDYWALGRDLIRPGGLFIADNVVGSGAWWIDEESHPDRRGVDTFNRMVAADPDFEAVAVPLREGVLIARRSEEGRAAARAVTSP